MTLYAVKNTNNITTILLSLIFPFFIFFLFFIFQTFIALKWCGVFVPRMKKKGIMTNALQCSMYNLQMKYTMRT